MSEWQDIGSAPKDGSPVELKVPGHGEVLAFWSHFHSPRGFWAGPHRIHADPVAWRLQPPKEQS